MTCFCIMWSSQRAKSAHELRTAVEANELLHFRCSCIVSIIYCTLLRAKINKCNFFFSKTKYWPHKPTESSCKSWPYTHTWCQYRRRTSSTSYVVVWRKGELIFMTEHKEPHLPFSHTFYSIFFHSVHPVTNMASDMSVSVCILYIT
jgi:hypothetical protein